MNKTNFEHFLYSFIISIIMICVGIPLLIALTLPVTFFIGREYSQVEYKVRDLKGISLTDMQIWHVLKGSYWSLDNVMDIVLPVLSSVIIFISIKYFGIQVFLDSFIIKW